MQTKDAPADGTFMGWSMAGSALVNRAETTWTRWTAGFELIATDHVPAELYEKHPLAFSEQELIVWRPRHYCLKNGTTHEMAFRRLQYFRGLRTRRVFGTMIAFYAPQNRSSRPYHQWRSHRRRSEWQSINCDSLRHLE